MSDKLSFDWTSFCLHMYYRVEPALVYRAWATAEGLTSFFIRSATMVAPDGKNRGATELVAADDRYTWEWHHDYTLEGKILKADSRRQLCFTFGPQMEVAVSFYPVTDGTLLKLEQTGIPDSSELDKAHGHLNCRSCWTFFITNLKSVLEYGFDLREKSLHRSDCIGIDFVPGELNN